MSESREFPLGTVLSIVGERLVAPDRMGGVYEILNYMTGDNLFTHQLPSACRKCRPVLLEQHPQLESDEMVAAFYQLDEAIRAESDQKVIGQLVNGWVESLVPHFGETLAVKPLAPGVHTPTDPIDDLIAKVGKDKVIVITRDA